MSTTNPLTKIGRQHEKTWYALQKRLSSLPFDYHNIMPDNVYRFINNKATSVSSCVGYFLPAILTTVSYLLAKAKVTIKTVNHAQPTNLYFIFVGYPGTGKSAAIEHGCMKPLHKIMQEDFNNCVIERSTSSGLVKHLANNGNGFIVSPEVYDVLYKLLKSDEKTCSGDAMLLCKLFSGERLSFNYATQDARNIDANTPFSILGSTQLPNAAKLVARMDNGQGLVDRFLFSIPLALCPKSEEIERAIAYLETESISDLEDIYRDIIQFHLNDNIQYTFDDETQALLKNE